MIDELSAEDSIFRIGRVIAVEGRAVKVRVDKTKNSSHLFYKGELLKNVSVGGYVKIYKGFTTIIGKVEGEFISEDKFFTKTSYGREQDRISRVLNLSLLGFFNGNRFERGIKELPLIDNECFILHLREFEQIHNFVKSNDTPLRIGTLTLEKGQHISVGINSLFASHIGIFGNTGSGKSYTLAKIYRELFELYKTRPKFTKYSRFLIIDFNGEYIDEVSNVDNVIIEPKYKKTFCLSTRHGQGDKYEVTQEFLYDPDFWIVFLEATEKTQMPFLRRAVLNEYMSRSLQDEPKFKKRLIEMIQSVTNQSDKAVDRSTVTALLDEVHLCFGQSRTLGELSADYRSHLKYHSSQQKYYYQNGSLSLYSDNPTFAKQVIEDKIEGLSLQTSELSEVEKLRLQIVLVYYDEIVKGFSNREHLGPLIKRLDKRIQDLTKVIKVGVSSERHSKFLTIISLKDVNIHMRKIIPLLICKRIYNEKKSSPSADSYLNIIIDEAHNILSQVSERESEQWKDYRLETFEEIIKEGRKFGVFLTIASQRPADISPTIISQLHNYFLHRLINNEDIRAVEKTISYLDKVSFELLPILPTGTCIMAGLVANIPVVLDISEITPSKYEPKNKTVSLTENWE